MSDTFESMPNYKILNCCYNCEYFDNFYCSKHEKMLCISHGICSSYKERKSYINNHPDSNDEKINKYLNTMANITLIPEDCSCYIALRLKEKDSMRVFMTPWGDEVDTEGKEFLVIYCDSYGDPDTVNGLIIDKLTNYKTVFHYIIEGNRCTPYEENSYYEILDDPEAPEPMSREELQLLADSLDSNTFVYILEERKGMIMSNTS